MNHFVTVTKLDECVRAKHHTWDHVDLLSPCFANMVTIDPGKVDDVWASLSVDTRALEFQALPLLLHRAVCETITTTFLKRLWGEHVGQRGPAEGRGDPPQADHSRGVRSGTSAAAVGAHQQLHGAA